MKYGEKKSFSVYRRKGRRNSFLSPFNDEAWTWLPEQKGLSFSSMKLLIRPVVLDSCINNPTEESCFNQSQPSRIPGASYIDMTLTEQQVQNITCRPARTRPFRTRTRPDPDCSTSSRHIKTIGTISMKVVLLVQKPSCIDQSSAENNKRRKKTDTLTSNDSDEWLAPFQAHLRFAQLYTQRYKADPLLSQRNSAGGFFQFLSSEAQI